jgi:hypothetical protein
MTGKLVTDSGIASNTVVTLAGVQVLTNKTLVTPTIASFANAVHDHSDVAHGGKVLHSSLDSIGPNDHHAQVHGLTSSDHAVSGLTSGHFLKALTATSFGFAPHGLTYTDVNAASATHNHDAAYSPLNHNHDTVYYTKTELLATNGQHNKVDWSQIANAPANYVLPTASSTVLGGVKVGAGLTIDAGGILSATYTLPTASSTILGGVKVGNGLAIDAGGSLSVTADAVFQYSRLDSPSLIVLKDLRATGVNGGTLTAGGWRTRIVNTLENPFACTWITLAANRFTLAAGRYEVEIDVSGCHLAGAIARLQSTSGTPITMLSTPTYANSDTETDNLIAGVFELTQTTEFEIQHYCVTTRNSDGMGRALNIAGIQEQYLLARIWRLR